MSTPTPPLAPREPTRLEQHGDLRIDDYSWLRNRADPRVLAYLQAENDYITAMLHHTKALQAQLYSEMRARLQEDDCTYPDQIGDYFYYRCTLEGQQYPVYCRRRGSMESSEEVLLDVNALAVGEPYARIGNYRISPDHSLLAYSFDNRGDESYTLYVKDLASGELLAERIPNTYYGLEWSNDSRTLYYTVLDAAMRPYQVYRHRVGVAGQPDELLFSENDIRFEVRLRKCKSRTMIVIGSKSNTSSEEWMISAADAQARPTIIAARRPGIEYSVTQHGERLFITTNDEALNFRVMVAPVATPGRDHWQEWLPHRPEVLVQGTDAYRDYLVVYEREQGLRQLRVYTFASGADRRVPLPEAVYAISRHENPVFESSQLRFYYESLVTTQTVYDFDMATNTLYQRKQETVHGYDPVDYVTQRIWATAPDGVQVPISLVHRKGLALDGQNPLLLHGYGSYGSSWDANFDAKRISLLARGFVLAVAHIRGGSELGRAWYEQGKLLHKMNTFTDFIACAEALIRQGYTAPSRLVIAGRSAGGLLVGAVVNLRPDLFAGALAGVPFVDVISTMQDPTIPLTAQEYEEWGDPADPVQYAYLRAYSPYDNVENKRYPHLLATAGYNDPRVQYWEPAKWVAKLRQADKNPGRVLLKTNLAAGHSGASGRYDYLHEAAFEYAFFLDTVD